MNQAILIGRLGRDPEIGRTDNGKAYARLSLATSETWRDKNSGERQERTQWHRIVAWGDGLSSMLQMYAKKGGAIAVVGKVTTRSFEKNGETRYVTEIVVQGAGGSIRLLGGKDDGGAGVPPPEDEYDGYGAGYGE